MSKSDSKRQAILENAYRLFRAQGFDGTSMADHLSSRRIEGNPLQPLPLEGRAIRRMHDGGPGELHVGHSEAPRRIPDRYGGRASQLWHERPQFHLLTRTGRGASLDDRGGGPIRHWEAFF